MGERKQNLGNIILTICILVFLSAFTVCNFGLVKSIGERLISKEIVFSEFVQEVQKTYTSDEFTLKNSFINLNGLWGRITGRREYNEVLLLKNGMLGGRLYHYDMDPIKKSVNDCAQWMKEKDIPFVYVQAPYKEDLEGELFPKGVEAWANQMADELLGYLEEENVQTLDLRPFTSANAEMVKKYFYRTDHHWNYDGAFVATQQIMKYIDEMFPEKELDLAYADMAQWQAHTLEDWFLGSRGKRVGSLYGGVDDFTYYTPKFDTDISFSMGKRRQFFRGTFEEAIMRNDYIENKDYYNANPYSLYIGGSYPVVKLQNHKVPNDMKVVVIGDSFSHPVYALLSAVVSEVHAIDPRYSMECSVAEYIEVAEPDVVLFLINPSVYIGTEFLNLGVETLCVGDAHEGICVIENEQVQLKKTSSKNNYKKIYLEQGKTYVVTFEDVTFEEGISEGVTLSVYNVAAKERICSSMFDVEFCRENKEFRWVFRTPVLESEDEIILQFYAGISNATEGIECTYQNVTLISYD